MILKYEKEHLHSTYAALYNTFFIKREKNSFYRKKILGEKNKQVDFLYSKK